MRLHAPALLLLPILAAGTWFAHIYTSQDNLVFPRTVNTIPALNPQPSPFQKLSLTTPDGTTLNGVLFTSKGASPTLLLAFAGNAHDVVGFSNWLKNDVLPTQLTAVAGLSYRGYPNVLTSPSTGTPSQKNLEADALFIYDTLVQRLKPAHVDAIGYSLGSALATYLAVHRPIRNLVLVAPPASIRRLAQEMYPLLPVTPFIKNPFATEDIIASVHASTTIIYTPTDGLIPPSHPLLLHQRHPAATLIALTGTDHANILYHSEIMKHLRQIWPPAPNTTPSAKQLSIPPSSKAKPVL